MHGRSARASGGARQGQATTQGARMAVSILGAGHVGMALAKALVSKGESVALGVPDPAKYRDAVIGLGPLARIGTTQEAIAAADVVILAIPY
ncbi:MAG: NAD(P)-binding domain-containing protein, partial [Burkholderiaceae bacterium]|nr:NAD(P)-binding domain-containing protein [Burkholderiaceae bacterium]